MNHATPPTETPAGRLWVFALTLDWTDKLVARLFDPAPCDIPVDLDLGRFPDELICRGLDMNRRRCDFVEIIGRSAHNGAIAAPAMYDPGRGELVVGGDENLAEAGD